MNKLKLDVLPQDYPAILVDIVVSVIRQIKLEQGEYDVPNDVLVTTLIRNHITPHDEFLPRILLAAPWLMYRHHMGKEGYALVKLIEEVIISELKTRIILVIAANSDMWW